MMDKETLTQLYTQAIKTLKVFLCLKYLPNLIGAILRYLPALFILIAVLAVIKPGMVLIGKNLEASIRQQELEQKREEAQDRIELQQQREEQARRDAIVREWRRNHPKDGTVFTWEDLQAKKLITLEIEKQRQEELKAEQVRRRERQKRRELERSTRHNHPSSIETMPLYRPLLQVAQPQRNEDKDLKELEGMVMEEMRADHKAYMQGLQGK